MFWNKEGDEGVSEVVGNLLILLITVALFSVVLSFVYTIPGPEATIQAEIVPMLERTSAVDGTLHLQHTGGETLSDGETAILISIDDTPQTFKVSDGLPAGKTTMEPGDTWSMDFLGTVSTSAKIDVKIVDRTSNSLLFYTVVQRGVSAGGNHDPIIAYAWTDATNPDLDVLPNNNYSTWRIYAVCKDIDGDLPPTGSVTASITSVDNGDGTFTVTSFAGGPTPLADNRGDGVFMTGLLKVATTVTPGDFSFTITATDDSGRSANAVVKVVVSTSYSSVRVVGTDEAPTLLKSGESNKLFLKLEFLANGESINTNQIRVRKLGTIPYYKVWVYGYWDKNRNGVLEIGTDYFLPGGGGFTSSNLRDFIGSPLFTCIEDEPTYVWFVISVASGTEGHSVGLRIESQNSITCIGVSTPIRILPIGSFPIDSSILTIKGVFKLWGYNECPYRILTGTDHVKFTRLRYKATGETVFIHQINLTLRGNIDPGEVTCYLKDEWGTPLTGDLPFNLATRRCLINAPPGGWKIDKSWSDREIDVYLNINGTNGDTLGIQVDTAEDTFAITEVSMDGINPEVVSEPIPSPTIKTLASAGRVTVDREYSTHLPTRAGANNIFQRQWLFRCYGEPIEFYSIKMTLMGTIQHDEVRGVRLRVHQSWCGGISYDQTLTFDSNRTALFRRAVPTTPMWTVPVNSDFYGWIRVRTYVHLEHDTEGDTILTGVAAATDYNVSGQVTGIQITPSPYGGGDIPTWGNWRTVNGQLYAWGHSLIPDPLVDSSQNVPVHKITLRCEGQAVRLNSVPVNKLGTVAGNLVTVRLYQDVNNDTVSKLGPDDVELDPTDAGSFVANQITFTPPNYWMNPGTAYNLIIVYSLNLGTAGWTLGCQVNANGMSTTTAAPNGVSAYPNQCLNLTRNPPLAMPSDTVPIRDRGRLEVFMEDLSTPNPQEGTIYSWMKLTFYAEGENVDVNRIRLTAWSNGTPQADFTKVRVGIIHDANNDSVWQIGTESVLGDTWFNSFGYATYLAAPLFTVDQREEYNLLVVIWPSTDSRGNFSLSINQTTHIQSKGQVSSHNIPPLATFPMATVERTIVP